MAVKIRTSDGPTAQDLVNIANDKFKSKQVRRAAELHLIAVRDKEPGSIVLAREFVKDNYTK